MARSNVKKTRTKKHFEFFEVYVSKDNGNTYRRYAITNGVDSAYEYARLLRGYSFVTNIFIRSTNKKH